MRQLDHPQVVKLLDYFVEDHRAYLVLEHIDGASLRNLLDSQGCLPEAQVRSLADQMCNILSYLHNLLTGKDPEPISVSHPKKDNASVSALLDQVVAKATAANIKNRYQRIEEQGAELQS